MKLAAVVVAALMMAAQKGPTLVKGRYMSYGDAAQPGGFYAEQRGVFVLPDGKESLVIHWMDGKHEGNELFKDCYIGGGVEIIPGPCAPIPAELTPN